MRKIKKYKWILTTILIICLSLMTIGGTKPKEDQYIHVGIAVYDLKDTFMDSFISMLEKEIEKTNIQKKISYEICDAKGD